MMNSLSPVICTGCGGSITDDDEPNIIIGKDPKHFCAMCTRYGSMISKEGAKWRIDPLVCSKGNTEIDSVVRDRLNPCIRPE
jgi:hypothetical protein